MGVDVHGRDSTKAACRAVSDAIRHSSLPLLQEVRAFASDFEIYDQRCANPSDAQSEIYVSIRP